LHFTMFNSMVVEKYSIQYNSRLDCEAMNEFKQYVYKSLKYTK